LWLNVLDFWIVCGVMPGVEVRLLGLDPGCSPGDVGNELGDGIANELVLLLWAKFKAVGLFLGRELFVIPFDGAFNVIGPDGSAEVGDTAWLDGRLEKASGSGAVDSNSGDTVLRAELKLDSVPPLSSLRDGVSSTDGVLPS
jgi:hypothetical protein